MPHPPNFALFEVFLKKKYTLQSGGLQVDFSYNDCVTGLSQGAETPLVQYALHLHGI